MSIKETFSAVRKVFILCLLVSLSQLIYALSFPLPEKDQAVIGKWHYIKVEPGDTSSQIAFAHDVSIDELLKYNKHIHSKSVIYPEETLLIPNCYIVPPLLQPNKIIINLANRILYYQPPGQQRLLLYPVTIGKPSNPTPLGNFYIVRKKINQIGRAHV